MGFEIKEDFLEIDLASNAISAEIRKDGIFENSGNTISYVDKDRVIEIVEREKIERRTAESNRPNNGGGMYSSHFEDLYGL